MAKKRAVNKPKPREVEVEQEEDVIEMRELSVAESLYIRDNLTTKTAQQMAEALQIPVELVIVNLPQRQRSKMQELMGSKPKYGVKVMTQAASEWSEAVAKKINPKDAPHIFKPYGT